MKIGELKISGGTFFSPSETSTKGYLDSVELTESLSKEIKSNKKAANRKRDPLQGIEIVNLEKELKLVLYMLNNGFFLVLPTQKLEVESISDMYFPSPEITSSQIHFGKVARLLPNRDDLMLTDIGYYGKPILNTLKQKIQYHTKNAVLEAVTENEHGSDCFSVSFAWDLRKDGLTYSQVIGMESDIGVYVQFNSSGRTYFVTYESPEKLGEDEYDDFLLHVVVQGKDGVTKKDVKLDEAKKEILKSGASADVTPTLSKDQLGHIGRSLLFQTQQAMREESGINTVLNWIDIIGNKKYEPKQEPVSIRDYMPKVSVGGRS